VLRTDRERDVLVWTLDRPQAKNALSGELLRLLGEAVEAAGADPTVRAAILTGAGGAFASGGDLRELRDKSTPGDAAVLSDAGESVCRRIGELSFPVIAAVSGVAIGGGAELALACDMRIADDSARICFKQVRMGATTAWGSLPRLVALVGPSAAARALYTAHELTAVEARAMGLVDFVAEEGASVVTALAWCTDVAAGARGAIAETKALLRASNASFYAHARALEREAFIRTWSSGEHAEAMAAYFERRPSRF
jgi:enoyl-CoA hydratase/carnithine racemase